TVSMDSSTSTCTRQALGHRSARPLRNPGWGHVVTATGPWPGLPRLQSSGAPGPDRRITREQAQARHQLTTDGALLHVFLVPTSACVRASLRRATPVGPERAFRCTSRRTAVRLGAG